jgi:hypothetical protein
MFGGGASRGGFQGLGASLAGFGESGPSAIDSQFFEWPIPQGLSRSLNRGGLRVLLRRTNPQESWGFSLATNPTGASAGIYIATIIPASPAADGGLVKAMSLRSINKVSVEGRTRQDAVGVIQQCAYEMELELSYDPKGYVCMLLVRLRFVASVCLLDHLLFSLSPPPLTGFSLPPSPTLQVRCLRSRRRAPADHAVRLPRDVDPTAHSARQPSLPWDCPNAGEKLIMIKPLLNDCGLCWR